MLGLIFFVLGGAIGIIGRLLSRNSAPQSEPVQIVDCSLVSRIVYSFHRMH